MKSKLNVKGLKLKILGTIVFIYTFNFLLLTFVHSAQMTGIVTTTRGDVQVLPNKAKKWRKAKPGEFLYEGDTVKTLKKSQVATTLSNGVAMKVNQNTEFSFDIGAALENVASKIKMKAGQIWTNVRPHTKFEIHTPVAIVAVRGTEFDTDLSKGNLHLTVYRGTVNLKNDHGNVNVKEGKETTTSGDSAPQPPKDSDKKQGKWSDEMKSKGSHRMESKNAKPVTDVPFELDISVLDANDKLDKSAKTEITVKADPAGMQFSPDGAGNWSDEFKASPADGVLKFFAKSSAAGTFSLLAASEDYTAGNISITVLPSKNKTLKIKVKSSSGDGEIDLKFKRK